MTLNRHTSANARMEAPFNDDTWKDWFQHHGPKLLLCARQWTRSLADAEDVVQEAFVRFWRHQRHLPGEPRALLIASIRRAAIDLVHKADRRAAREEFSAKETSRLFESDPAGDDRVQLIQSAMARLPEGQREVLVLKIWGELTFDEISRELDIPLNTAASRYRYALVALRQELIVTENHG